MPPTFYKKNFTCNQAVHKCRVCCKRIKAFQHKQMSGPLFAIYIKVTFYQEQLHLSMSKQWITNQFIFFQIIGDFVHSLFYIYREGPQWIFVLKTTLIVISKVHFNKFDFLDFVFLYNGLICVCFNENCFPFFNDNGSNSI